jgi:hypothetical protein
LIDILYDLIRSWANPKNNMTDEIPNSNDSQAIRYENASEEKLNSKYVGISFFSSEPKDTTQKTDTIDKLSNDSESRCNKKP